jgi:hypothetical protein
MPLPKNHNQGGVRPHMNLEKATQSGTSMQMEVWADKQAGPSFSLYNCPVNKFA